MAWLLIVLYIDFVGFGNLLSNTYDFLHLCLILFSFFSNSVFMCHMYMGLMHLHLYVCSVQFYALYALGVSCIYICMFCSDLSLPSGCLYNLRCISAGTCCGDIWSRS